MKTPVKKTEGTDYFLSQAMEHPVFGVSEKHPIHAMYYAWPQKQAIRHDMHFGIELGILLKGSMERHYRDYKVSLLPGDAWICGMWEPHGYRVEEQSEAVVTIAFPPVLRRNYRDQSHPVRWLAPFETPPSKRPRVATDHRRQMLDLGRQTQILATTPQENKEVWLCLKLQEALLLMQSRWVAPAAPPESSTGSVAAVNKALKMVFDGKRAVTTQDAARACGMNRNAFAHHFRDVMGTSFSEFGLRYRTNAAAEQLRNIGAPVKAIAAEWGFADTSHFHRCFKRFYNCSPTAYRRTQPTLPQKKKPGR